MKRFWVYPAFVLALLLLDTVTKIWNDTPWWGWHEVPTPWYALAGVGLFFVFSFWRPIRIPLLIAGAGALGNSLWAYDARGVPNPWVAESQGPFDIADLYLIAFGESETVAFNTADVFIWVGMTGMVIGGFVWSVGVLREYFESKRYAHPARESRYTE